MPLSVTAFSQEELNELGIVGYEGIAQNTPGIVVNRPTQNFNNFTSRGINTNGYSASLQSAVAIYIDELPISANGNSTILDPNLFDVERVEFLRGPQGTLFGSSSLAGAMRIITRSPDLDEFQASALVDFGLTGSDSVRQRYNAMINMPIVDGQVSASAPSAIYRNEDGWVDNIGTGIENSNSLEAYGVRAMLLFRPTDRLSVRLLASYENSMPADSGLINPLRGEYVRRSDRPDLFQGELTNYNVTVNYDLDFAELISSTTLSTYDASFYVDLQGTFAQRLPVRARRLAYDDLFVQEARLVSAPGGRVRLDDRLLLFRQAARRGFPLPLDAGISRRAQPDRAAERILQRCSTLYRHQRDGGLRRADLPLHRRFLGDRRRCATATPPSSPSPGRRLQQQLSDPRLLRHLQFPDHDHADPGGDRPQGRGRPAVVQGERVVAAGRRTSPPMRPSRPASVRRS